MNKLIIWVDTKKTADRNMNPDYLRDCVVDIIRLFENGKTVIGLPIEFKDLLTFEVIEGTEEIEIEWKEKANV